MSLTETINLLTKLNNSQVFDFITDKPTNFTDELNQLESYVFSVYSADLWDYDPQVKTDDFITYLKYTYKDKWQTIYRNDWQSFGSEIFISQNTKKEDNNNYIQTNDGIKATLSGTDINKNINYVRAESLNINDIKSFFTIVLDDIKKEVLIYTGE